MSGGTWITAKKDAVPSMKTRFENFIDYLFMTNGEEILSSADGMAWGTDNLINTILINSIGYVNPNVTLNVGAGHGVVSGDSIVVAGNTKAIPLVDIAYATPNLTLTVASGHGVKAGETVIIPTLIKTIAITNVSYASPLVTLTVGAGHGALPGNTVIISSLDYAYNGPQVITAVTATTIVFSLSGLSAPVTVVGNALISEDVFNINVTGVAYANPNVTLTVPTGHNIIAGTVITVSGLDTAYNGVQTVTSVTATTVVFSKAGLSAPVITVGKILAQFYSGSKTVASVTATTIVITKTGLPSPIMKTGTLSATDLDYNGVQTVASVSETTIVFSKAGIVATAPIKAGAFTIGFTLAGKDIVEYSNLLYIIGLKNFESDIIWCEIPTKNALNKYFITWNRYNSLTIATGDGEDLIGGVVCRGALFLFKNSSLFRAIAPLEDNGYKEISKSIGASDRRNIQVIGEKLVFFCEGRKNVKKGFYSFDPLVDNTPKIVSEGIQPYIDGMDSATEVVAGVKNNLYIAYLGAVKNLDRGIDMQHCYMVFNPSSNKMLGVWDLGVDCSLMDQLTVQGQVELCMGDFDGKVWMLEYGDSDANEFGEGKPIELDVESQIFDISMTDESTRSNYIKRAVKNIWIFGDHLENLRLKYRFNPKSSDKEGWYTAKGGRSPIWQIPIKIQDVYTWQFGLVDLSKKANSPVVRKVRIEYE
jgi:putative intracellular protease/amidase